MLSCHACLHTSSPTLSSDLPLLLFLKAISIFSIIQIMLEINIVDHNNVDKTLTKFYKPLCIIGEKWQGL